MKTSFQSSSRPVLHAAARVVQEMGKSRAAAFALGLLNIEGDVVNTYAKRKDWDHGTSESEGDCHLFQWVYFVYTYSNVSKYGKLILPSSEQQQ